MGSTIGARQGPPLVDSVNPVKTRGARILNLVVMFRETTSGSLCVLVWLWAQGITHRYVGASYSLHALLLVLFSTLFVVEMFYDVKVKPVILTNI